MDWVMGDWMDIFIYITIAIIITVFINVNMKLFFFYIYSLVSFWRVHQGFRHMLW